MVILTHCEILWLINSVTYIHYFVLCTQFSVIKVCNKNTHLGSILYGALISIEFVIGTIWTKEIITFLFRSTFHRGLSEHNRSGYTV